MPYDGTSPQPQMQGPFKNWFDCFQSLYIRMGFSGDDEAVDVKSINVGAEPDSRMSPFTPYGQIPGYEDVLEVEYHVSDGLAFDFARMFHDGVANLWYWQPIAPFGPQGSQ